MKNKSKIINIVVVSLDDAFGKLVSSSLASRLDMYYLDVKEMVEYDLMDAEEVLEKCGIEYLKKREEQTLRKCSTFENTVMFINFDLLKEKSELFKNSLIVYLKLQEKEVLQIVNKIDYDYRNDELKKISDSVILLDRKSKMQAIHKIEKYIGENL